MLPTGMSISNPLTGISNPLTGMSNPLTGMTNPLASSKAKDDQVS
jgi:hypothetical protein